MFTASRFSSERTESRTRSTNVFTAFSLTRRPGGTISRTTGVEASASRKGRCMRARMGPRSYLNVLGDLRRPGTFLQGRNEKHNVSPAIVRIEAKGWAIERSEERRVGKECRSRWSREDEGEE